MMGSHWRSKIRIFNEHNVCDFHDKNSFLNSASKECGSHSTVQTSSASTDWFLTKKKGKRRKEKKKKRKDKK